MPRVRIKRLPSNKRKVRIKKYPSTDYSLPNKVNYAGLQKFIFDGGGVAGGVNSPIDKQLPKMKTLPPKIIPTLADEREEGTFTQDFKRKDMFNFDAESFLNQANTVGRGVAGFFDRMNAAKQERELMENMTAPEELYASQTQDFRGGFNPNSGLFEEQKMGAKDLTLIQKGGTVPKYQDKGEVKSTGTYNPDEYVEVTAGYTGYVNPAAADTGDESTYFGDYGAKPVTKKMRRSEYDELLKLKKEYEELQNFMLDYKFKRRGETEAKSFRERGWKDPKKNPGYKGQIPVEEVKKASPEYYNKLKALETRVEELTGLPFADLRGKRESGEGITSKVENKFGVRQANLTLDLKPVYSECPKCPDGTTPQRDKDNNCLPCAEAKEEVKECQPCADGSTAVKQKNPQTGEEECVCQGEQPMAQPKAPAPFYLQDTIKTTGIASDLAGVKKYLPYAAPVDFEEVSMARVDPTAALAANAEQANIASQAAASFAGPQGTARLSGIQSKAAGNAANLLDQYNRQNVGFQNQEAAANVDIRNKEALANQKIKQGLYDATTIANQQFDNTKRAMRTALRDQYANALTNRYKADALNQMYPDYSFDPSVGGKFEFTPSPKKPDPTYEADFAEVYNKIGRLPGMTSEEASKTARQILAGKMRNTYNDRGAGINPNIYSQFFNVQQGGAIYEHGGAHKMPFGTSNMNQILPPGYSDAYEVGGIPSSSQTTRTIGAIPRDQANLEAEGGETVFGDINGDGFPEHNTIVGPRHAQGGVPLNLPDDSFIYSDYKTGGMKISDPNVLEMFGKSGKKKKGSRRKPAYTPAELSKQYDINKYRSLLEDPNSDKITRRTAELMIENYNMKLGALALAQESSKGFPQGIPMVARPYMQANGIREEDLIPPPPQPVAEQGGQMMPPVAQMQRGGWYY
tara:strand:- start:58 stop:2808 length:2751 start_codon:yes stop_codon:yes gene_type:complete